MPPAKKATGSAPKKGQKTRRREKKNVPHGAAHIKSTFNNTIVSITDPQGNVIAWASSRSESTRLNSSHITPSRMPSSA